MMKNIYIIKYICLLTLLFLSQLLFAQKIQKQTGIVRKIMYSTNDPLQPLSDVRIKIETETRSDEKGRFTANIPLTKNETYKIDSVSYKKDKKGQEEYTLVIPQKNQELHLSPNDLIIVLASKEEMERERKERENQLRVAKNEQVLLLQNLLAKKEKELNMLKETDDCYKRTVAERDSLKNICQNYFNNYTQVEKMISEQAERLARTDYGLLDSIELKKIELLKAGKGAEVQLLLRPYLPSDVEKGAKLIAESLKQKENREQNLKDALKENDNARHKDIIVKDEFCHKVEGMIEAFKLEFQNDSVAKYLNALVIVSPYNWQYQIDAGDFFDEYKADYETAMKYYNQALQIAKNQYGNNSKQIASTYHKIGNIHFNKADYTNANSFYQLAVHIRETETNIKKADLAESYNSIAKLLFTKGQFIEALEVYTKAQEIIRKYDNTNTTDIAKINLGIGEIYRTRGEYTKAIDLYNASLSIAQQETGESSLNVGEIYNCIGQVYLQEGKYDKAQELCKKSIELLTKIIGISHPKVAESYNSLGLVYQAQGNYLKAEEVFQKAIVIIENIIGTEHPALAACYNNLGQIYQIYGKYDQALNLYRKSLSILENKFEFKILIPLHPIVVSDKYINYRVIGLSL